VPIATSGRFTCICVLLLALPVLISLRALAAEPIPPGKIAAFELDPAQTTITYSLDGWPHHSVGTFKLKHGLIELDPASGKMDGIITVDAASGDSGHSVRDDRMKSTVLEVDQYPEISFVPRQVVSHGILAKEFPVTVEGLMALHGGQHDLAIEATVSREGDSVTINANFVIPYVAWGLDDPSILMFQVAKVVSLDVTAVARLSWRPRFARLVPTD
jgi:polyisoprenoid-binding protein YceI